MSRLLPFGKAKKTWLQPDYDEVIRHLADLIDLEKERTNGVRKVGSLTDVRLDLVKDAYLILQIARDGNAKHMRDCSKRLKASRTMSLEDATIKPH